MRKTVKKMSAVALALLMTLSVLSASAFAATPQNVKQYKYYLALGDSIGSGFGQPDYNKYGKVVVIDKRIKNSYPDLVAKWTGAKLDPKCYPGYTAGVLRYELDNTYKLPTAQIGQLFNMTNGAYDQKFLDQHRPIFQNAVKKADLITLDIGLNDTWYGTIATIYQIAEYGNDKIPGDPRGLLEDELAKYGSWGTVFRNAEAYLAGFALTPSKWAEFWGLWLYNMATYFTAYESNYATIVRNIFKLNPNTTVVALSSYNSFRYFTLTGGENGANFYRIKTRDGGPLVVNLPGLGEFALPDEIKVAPSLVPTIVQSSYDMFYEPVRKRFVNEYPGHYFYADVFDTEMIMDGPNSVPMYEFQTMDASGFNPHPTKAGHEYMAKQIVKQLPSRK